MSTYKLTGLSRNNVAALRETLPPDVVAKMTSTASTATLPLSREDALTLVTEARESAAAQHGRRGHPVQSLHAVIRKLSKVED